MEEMAASRSRWRVADILAASAALSLLSLAAGFSFSAVAVLGGINNQQSGWFGYVKLAGRILQDFGPVVKSGETAFPVNVCSIAGLCAFIQTGTSNSKNAHTSVDCRG